MSLFIIRLVCIHDYVIKFPVQRIACPELGLMLKNELIYLSKQPLHVGTGYFVIQITNTQRADMSRILHAIIE
jgi:hypothetical protein